MMKKSDIAVIILIVSISLVGSYIVAKTVLGDPQSHPVQAEVVDPITPGLTAPLTSEFNSNAINPTVNIQIGNSSNQQPFTGN